MGCLLLLLLVGLTNNDALLLAFFFLGRPIWPTCMLASCKGWLSPATNMLSALMCLPLPVVNHSKHDTAAARHHHAAFRQ